MIHPPFFIVGCARTGTTLLRTMLNQHSQVAIPLESLFIIDYLRGDPRTPREVFLKLILKEYEFHEWNIPFTERDFDGCSSAREFVDRAHELYLRHFAKTIWGQKTPRFVRYAPLLKRHYPGAKFIHVMRDPRAVASSLIRSNVHKSNAYFAARRWLRDVRAGIAIQQKYSTDAFSVRYEDLVASPETWLRQICEFLQIDFEPALLAYHEKGTAEYGRYYARIHAKLNEAPDPGRIEAWRSHLTARQIALIESICGDTMRETGYALDYQEHHVSGLYTGWLRTQRIEGLGSQIVHNAVTRRGYLTSFLRRKLALSLFLDTLREVNY